MSIFKRISTDAQSTAAPVEAGERGQAGNPMPSLAAPGVVPPATAPIYSIHPPEVVSPVAEIFTMARDAQQTAQARIRLAVATATSPNPPPDVQQTQRWTPMTMQTTPRHHTTEQAFMEGPCVIPLLKLTPGGQVSTHLLVNRAGEVTRLVGDQQRACHAGVASWRDTTDVNSITLGIEIASKSDAESYTDAQYGRVAEIVSHFCRRGLTVDDVVSHAEIAPGRGAEPAGWDWKRFNAMVQERLQPVSVGPSRLAYDRRSAERIAVEKTTAPCSTDGAPRGAQQKPRVSTSNTMKPADCTCKRTSWLLNALTLLAAGVVVIAETVDLAYWIGYTLPEKVRMWMLFGIGLVNIILRYRNRGPVRDEQRLGRAVPEAAMRISGRAQALGKRGAASGLPRRIR